MSNPYGDGTRRRSLQQQDAPAPELDIDELFIGVNPLFASLRFGLGVLREFIPASSAGELPATSAPFVYLDAEICDVSIEELANYDPVCGPDAITYPNAAAAACAGHLPEKILEGDCDIIGDLPSDTFDCTCPMILDEVCYPEPTYLIDGTLISMSTTYANARCAVCDGIRPDLLIPGPCPYAPMEESPTMDGSPTMDESPTMDSP